MGDTNKWIGVSRTTLPLKKRKISTPEAASPIKSQQLKTQKRAEEFPVKKTKRRSRSKIFKASISDSRFTVKHQCAVCEEDAAGFHFGAFTCEGCKSFFGRCTEENSERIKLGECKTGGQCSVKGRNRTQCKPCRFKKCKDVNMSRERSRYGRRSHYFKVQCAIEAQQHQKTLPTAGSPYQVPRKSKVEPGKGKVKGTTHTMKREEEERTESSIFPGTGSPSLFHSSVIKSTAPTPPASLYPSSTTPQLFKPIPHLPSPLSFPLGSFPLGLLHPLSLTAGAQVSPNALLGLPAIPSPDPLPPGSTLSPSSNTGTEGTASSVLQQSQYLPFPSTGMPVLPPAFSVAGSLANRSALLASLYSQVMAGHGGLSPTLEGHLTPKSDQSETITQPEDDQTEPLDLSNKQQPPRKSTPLLTTQNQSVLDLSKKA